MNKRSRFLKATTFLLKRSHFLTDAQKDFVLRNIIKLKKIPNVEIEISSYSLLLDLDHMFHRLMALGLYDPKLKTIMGKTLRRGDVYVDVGGEIGYFACNAGAIIGETGVMVLFEPDPRAHTRIVSHIQSGEKAHTPRTHIFNEACSDRVGKASLFLEATSGQSHIDHAPDSTESGYVEVNTNTLDQRIHELGISSIRLMKMDIEGHEIKALRGMAVLLENKQIDFIVIEKNNGMLMNNGFLPFHLHALFVYHGYCGASESGEPITIEVLRRDDLENLVYAKNASLMKSVFPEIPDEMLLVPCVPKKFFDEAMNMDYPGHEIKSVISLASSGKLDEAIWKACELVNQYPFLVNLKGDLAHWLHSTGRDKEACEMYLRTLEQDPDNEEIRQILSRMHAR